MKIIEISLDKPSSVLFGEVQIATAERRYKLNSDGKIDRDDDLLLSFKSGSALELSSAVDVSEQINVARIFVVEGHSSDYFLVFGGEILYWLGRDGKLLREFKTLRDFDLVEYWKTYYYVQESFIVIIYESDIIKINNNLEVVWHRPKHLIDCLLGAEDGKLRFERDGEKFEIDVSR
jgi:hypothetical protein